MTNRSFLLIVAGLVVAAVGLVGWLTASVPTGDPPAPSPPPPRADWAQPLRAHRTPLPTPKPGDWLTEHHEPGQSIERYRASDPVRPDDRLTTIYVLPLGRFEPDEWRILQETVEFMGAYFCLPTRILPVRSTDDFPADARRTGLGFGPQLHVEHVLARILRPTRPPDAVAYLALTATDLWPGEGWNFVYGMAYPAERLGVWSFRRNGDLATERLRFLERTLKIAVHETGHILGLAHCTAWSCLMNGVNHREEADRAPLTLCPEDLVKLAWNTGCEPRGRLRRLAALTDRLGLPAAREYREMLTRLGDQSPQQ